MTCEKTTYRRNFPPVVGEYSYYDGRYSMCLRYPHAVVTCEGSTSAYVSHYSSPYLLPTESRAYITCHGIITSTNISNNVGFN